MREAASVPGIDGMVDALVEESLSVCETSDAWFAALRVYPAALGVNDASFVGDVNLLVACWGHEDTPVCLDADADCLLGGEG